MKIIFYQANFCAECGNAMKPRFSLKPRYFCDECEAHLGRRNYFKSVAGLWLCATLAVFALNRTLQPNPSGQSPNIQGNSGASISAVSARDTVTTRNLESKPEVETQNLASLRVMCGARTKKGTPCRRLVPPGQRCAQHRGMASLLEARGAERGRAPFEVPAMTNDKAKMENGK
ncbi:MAG TPA: hypothetical protein VE715_07910 [Blastocatellia bacterium]|nr:hypothetical protein [Blastocatellia bacterium]